MKKDEVIEIAMGAAPFLGKPDAEMVAVLESIVAEVERRTLERAAVVCDELKARALAAQSAGDKSDLSNIMLRQIAHAGYGEASTAIRALKEEVCTTQQS